MDVEDIVAHTKAEPRPYQSRVVTNAYNCFTARNMRSVLIESPTGSGKTIMALVLASALLKNDSDKFRSIGWVAMRRHLLKQVQAENEVKGFNLPISYISMFDKDPPANLDILIVDEAQHDVTTSMAHIHATVKPKIILGLSATPFRADRVKLCFDSVVKDAGIPTLIRDGFLAPYQHFTIPRWGVDEVVRLYAQDPVRWGKSIMYFHRLAQCDEARDKLLRHGVPCDVVSGSSDTEHQLEAFHENKLKVMINCMKLTEGFDCPDLKTVFIRPSCKPVTIQMAGRVLRIHPDFAFKQIVQSEKTPYPFMKTALATIQHIQTADGWRTLQVNPNIDNVSQKTIVELARIETTMPEYIANKLKPKTRGERLAALRRERARTGGGENDEVRTRDDFEIEYINDRAARSSNIG